MIPERMRKLRAKISAQNKFANAAKLLLAKQSKSPRNSLKMVEVSGRNEMQRPPGDPR
jgi:hypothetical protein